MSRRFRATVIMIFIAGAVVGIATASVGEDDRVVPATAEEPSYQLSDFKTVYPYIDTTSEDVDISDPSRAGVIFDVAWTTETYPGEARCEIALVDSSGNGVGSWIGDVKTMMPFQDGRVPMPVEVQAEPAGGSGLCEAANSPAPGARYEFANLQIVREESVRLKADVTWSTGVPVGTGDCVADFRLKNGESRTIDFTLGAPEGRIVILLLPDTMADATPISASCLPYTVPDLSLNN